MDPKNYCNSPSPLLTRDSCPICYFGTSDTQSIAQPNPRIYNTYNRKVKDGSLNEWIKDLSPKKMAEQIQANPKLLAGLLEFGNGNPNHGERSVGIVILWVRQIFYVQ